MGGKEEKSIEGEARERERGIRVGTGENIKVYILAKDLFVWRIYCHRKSTFPGKGE